jgi:hypothetical protein
MSDTVAVSDPIAEPDGAARSARSAGPARIVRT